MRTCFRFVFFHTIRKFRTSEITHIICQALFYNCRRCDQWQHHQQHISHTTNYPFGGVTQLTLLERLQSHKAGVFPHLYSYCNLNLHWSGWPISHSLAHFYIVFIYYWTYSCPTYSWNTNRWTLSNNQSINLQFPW